MQESDGILMRQKKKSGEISVGFPFFDMHLHLLPGVDDGAPDISETALMLDQLDEQGVRCMCATPHFHAKQKDIKENILEAYHRTCELIAKEHSHMRLYLGQELFWSTGIIKALADDRAISLNSSRYVLVEFNPEEKYHIVYDAFRSIRGEGYIPVLAHMERMSCLWKNFDRLDELRELGSIFQMNAPSLCGSSFDSSVRECRKIVSEGYIDLLGTDSHSSTWRAPQYKEAALWILQSLGEETLRRLACDNPMRILSDRGL